MPNKIKVMIVDDSAVVRQTLTSVLTSDPKIGEVVSANDPFHAVEKLKKKKGCWFPGIVLRWMSYFARRLSTPEKILLES